MRIIQAHRKKVRAVALSGSGQLATGGADGLVRLWSLPAGEPRAPRWSQVARLLRFVDQDRQLAIQQADGSLVLYPLGEPAAQTRRIGGFSFLAFHPDRDTFLAGASLNWVGSEGRSVIRSRISDPASTYTIGAVSPGMTRVALAWKAPLFAGCVHVSQVTVHDAWSANRLRSLDHRVAVETMTFTPDDRWLIVAADRVLVVWSVADGREAARLEFHRGQVRALACTPDGRTLLSAGLDGRVGVWDLGGLRLRHALDWNIGRLRCLALAPDAMTAAAGGDSGQVVVWDLED